MSTIKFDAGPMPPRPQASVDVPRKKRKRAPAQGAADDCFTCVNRNIKCDRRRPYCSQCLDGGQDCSGYKTQLTWGVGVASRGKLRGLSLPVAGTAQTSGDTTLSSKSRKRNANNSSDGKYIHQQPTDLSAVPSGKSKTVNAGSANSKTTPSQPHSSRHQQHQGAPVLRPLATRALPSQYTPYNVQTDLASPPGIYDTSRRLPMTATAFPNTTNLSPVYDINAHHQPNQYATPSPTTQYFQAGAYPPVQPPTSNPHQYHTSPDPPSARSEVSYNSPTNHSGSPDYAAHPPGLQTQTALFDPPALTTLSNTNDEDIEDINRALTGESQFHDLLSVSPSSIQFDASFSFPLSGTSSVGKTPRMQYLIQYYAEVIAPVLVAFDSPSNPLRNQILGLAARSESLQHAIAALSASNLRQRQASGAVSTGKTPGARRSSYMHLNLTNEAWDDSLNLTIQDRKREETVHKYAAVRSLNLQLANQNLRKDDSVLATLLMLCLFHMCDSGIARFQTQFEGVKKLLALRGNIVEGNNGDNRWLTRFFTWFDSLASTVNDREGQLNGQYVEVSSQSDGEWSHEALTGVDGALFKTVSRLGRLNTLSQGKPVESNPTVVSRPVPPMPNLETNASKPIGNFDGNGWIRVMADENFFALKTASPTIQEQFWREWREVRQDLQTWTCDTNRFDGSNSSYPFLTPEQRYDMVNISESFRYSALLYTERLADPKASSLDTRLQEWVRKSLYHIRLVRADVYLLWPLFITGAECVDEQDRETIRERCLDIQNDSGFMNNSTCLSLLEKVWSADKNSAKGEVDRALAKTTFKFRDIMLAEANEGEWIVV